jgi:hypothetical protein
MLPTDGGAVTMSSVEAYSDIATAPWRTRAGAVGENPPAAAIMGAKDVPTGDGACVRTKQSALGAPSAISRELRIE